MTRDDIIKLARKADKYADKYAPSFSRKPDEWRAARDEHFAALVAAAEREACARLEDEPGIYSRFDMASAIRARSNK